MDDVTTHQVPWHATGHHPQAAHVHAVDEAAGRPVRDPRPGARACRAAGGRGSSDPEAEHRQSGAVRFRGARRDHARHDPGAAVRAGLFGLQGHPGRAPRRVHPLRTRRRLSPIRRRRRLSRQRRLRAHHDDAAGAAGQRRPGADPGPGLSAVDGVDLAGRRHPGALPVRRDPGLAARHRRPGVQDHRPHQGAGGDQPEQPDRRGVQPRSPRADGRTGPQAPTAAAGRRDLRQDPLRRRHAHQPGHPGAGPADADLQRACRRPTGSPATGRAGW